MGDDNNVADGESNAPLPLAEKWLRMKNLSHFSKTDIRSWQRGTRCSIYFPVGAGGGGVTTSLCWVQAPSPKAVSSMAMIMIFFRNFNLSRLLSSQVAPVRLGGEPSRSNAFLHFFELTQIGRTGLL
jgi:hypothetical protein